MKNKEDIKVTLKYGRNTALCYAETRNFVTYIDDSDVIRIISVYDADVCDIKGLENFNIYSETIPPMRSLINYGFKTVSYSDKFDPVFIRTKTISHKYMVDNGIYINMYKYTNKPLQEWLDAIRNNIFRYFDIIYPQGYYFNLTQEEIEDIGNKIFREEYNKIRLEKYPVRELIGKPKVDIGRAPETSEDKFDYLQVWIPFVENMRNRMQYVLDHKTAFLNVVKRAVTHDPEFRKYHIPYEHLELTRITITEDSYIVFYLDL